MSKDDGAIDERGEARSMGDRESRRVLRLLMGGVAIWGGLLALGAALFGAGAEGGIVFQFNPVRGLIVAGCVALFLGSWWALVRGRNRRVARNEGETR